MAGIKITALEEMKSKIVALQENAKGAIFAQTSLAAAKAVKNVIEAAAPIKTGQLKSSVEVFYGMNRSGTVGRLLIGPEKRKGYYGYFVDEGTIFIRGTGWFTNAIAAAEHVAEQAGEEAFSSEVSRET